MVGFTASPSITGLRVFLELLSSFLESSLFWLGDLGLSRVASPPSPLVFAEFRTFWIGVGEEEVRSPEDFDLLIERDRGEEEAAVVERKEVMGGGGSLLTIITGQLLESSCHDNEMR